MAYLVSLMMSRMAPPIILSTARDSVIVWFKNNSKASAVVAMSALKFGVVGGMCPTTYLHYQQDRTFLPTLTIPLPVPLLDPPSLFVVVFVANLLVLCPAKISHSISHSSRATSSSSKLVDDLHLPAKTISSLQHSRIFTICFRSTICATSRRKTSISRGGDAS